MCFGRRGDDTALPVAPRYKRYAIAPARTARAKEPTGPRSAAPPVDGTTLAVLVGPAGVVEPEPDPEPDPDPEPEPEPLPPEAVPFVPEDGEPPSTLR